MVDSHPRKYSSPLRESQVQETKKRILRAVFDLLNDNPFGDISMDDVAKAAGVQRRTVFRHFVTKEALFDAFWVYINETIKTSTDPSTLDDLLNGPTDSFPKFDRNEGVIRASLHTPAGFAMRTRSITARRNAFRTCLEETLAKVNPSKVAMAEAIVHLLYSASAWEILKDYAGLSGEEAGEAASWAIRTLLAAAMTSETEQNSKT